MHSEFSRELRNRALSPLSIAAYVTWLGVTISSVSWPSLFDGAWNEWAGLAALTGMLLLFIALTRAQPDTQRCRRASVAAVVAQGLLVLVAINLLQGFQVPVMLIVVAAQLFTMLAIWHATVIIVALNIIMVSVWTLHGAELQPLLLSLLPLMGFQAFAAMTALYAERSERRGDALIDLNAELQATQRLLEESTRSDERLHLSRELHDVAGHKLTALKLHLRALHRNPTFAGNEGLALSLQLADELLADIRAVVSELRQHDGIELGDALQALARPLPGVSIVLEGRDRARVASVAQAEALLRFAQEGLTNALRHGQASRVALRVETHLNRLHLIVEDDGRGRLPLIEGHGITGMRERLAGFGGELHIEQRTPRGLIFRAELPMSVTA